MMSWVAKTVGKTSIAQMVRQHSIYSHLSATCPKCDNGRAYFMQLQIRSADEPSTFLIRFDFRANMGSDYVL